MNSPKTDIPEKNSENIAQMFDRIANRYDFIKHLFSLNVIKLWRRRAINELLGLQLEKILDVATGTANMALAMQKRLNPRHIIGIDVSEGMLSVGRKKIKKKGLEQHISLELGTAEALHFDFQTFDAVTIAFGVRYFENPENGLREIYRVLKIGGKVVIVELSIPQNRIVRYIHSFYIFCIMSFFGRLLSNNASAYKYFPQSVQSFTQKTVLQKIMEDCGFDDIKIKTLTFGSATIYTGIKKTKNNNQTFLFELPELWTITIRK